MFIWTLVVHIFWWLHTDHHYNHYDEEPLAKKSVLQGLLISYFSFWINVSAPGALKLVFNHFSIYDLSHRHNHILCWKNKRRLTNFFIRLTRCYNALYQTEYYLFTLLLNCIVLSRNNIAWRMNCTWVCLAGQNDV